MTLRPIFSAQIDLEMNKLEFDNTIIYGAFNNRETKINGIKTILLTLIDDRKCQLKRLICFLNPDGPRKILKKESFIKNKLIESHSLKGKKHQEKLKYSHIEICLKFENPGNYFIIIFKEIVDGWLQFYVKIKKANENRCVFKMFKKVSDLEKIILKGLRHGIAIQIAKTENEEFEDGQMNVFNEDFFEKYNPENLHFVVTTLPLINDGIYEFYLDENGITREKEKIEAII